MLTFSLFLSPDLLLHRVISAVDIYKSRQKVQEKADNVGQVVKTTLKFRGNRDSHQTIFVYGRQRI